MKSPYNLAEARRGSPSSVRWTTASMGRELTRLEAENSRLRAALEQYADEENWLAVANHIFKRVWFPDPRLPLNDDHGYTLARRALWMEEA